ncbi:Pyridoxal-dependent decarboxylase [Gordonia bronchialis DSM 43247]|uniref:Pyridoxal-dependent decarboxylase n=1 Tax=Gordonia bronchialis (strain ATCC 25592 / DSM 43247 / BCRC 13721 / JCM 3198 / KCTC 3076 / NBRC 16047 / NCTC 10667) TaxID=526226 RepID=D0LDY3_GORB4|nr:Pyridoxal-dependent decarboxylase [Gordonia bronchialis DSM 43247]QGS23939.1 aminotransferase class V-fold PLP-dependent enzyme [Gordonia bronchialis]UAK39891.1 aminotransferase class V-fold PLP-dependent enzyme [Gordonia bronchialis]STQ65508.1 Glutamate decarboxylase alpha [Gordonia bronchialis]
MTVAKTSSGRTPGDILRALDTLREQDAPTHGGRVLSYVYDSGRAELDELAAAAIARVQPVNGLDPTVFRSVAALESDLITFGRSVFHAPDAVGTVTSGGTESCLLAVRAARDHAGYAPGSGSMVVPTTAHAAFLKAAELLGVRLIRLSVDPHTTTPTAESVAAAVCDDTFLLVASAPNYPTGCIDPIEVFGRVALDAGIALHVDACLGGFALPWWGADTEPFDFRVPGVTSLSADLHKYGYTPKGASLLLHADADRHRAQYFATTDWPGYPVVNPTLLGSRSAAGVASSWAITEYLGTEGFASLVHTTRAVTERIGAAIAAIDGLRVLGAPTGPVFAVAADPGGGDAVDPHRWAAAVARRGFALQMQPAFVQPDGTALPPTTHLTMTPVTATVADELLGACRAAADEVRGVPAAPPPTALAELAAAFDSGAVTVADVAALSSDEVGAALVAAGIDPADHTGELDMSTIMAAVATLPRAVTARMLTEFLARFTNP